VLRPLGTSLVRCRRAEEVHPELRALSEKAGARG
jgi:hypothetical protein